MSFKRYIFKSGLDIIAPLKCGTRWLNEFNIEERTDMLQFSLYNEELAQNIHSGILFIYRPVREHFISAIQTEWNMSPNKDISDIIKEMELGTCLHWYPHMYKKLYPLYLKFGFKFYNLRALSQLTLSASRHKWNSSLYEIKFPIGHVTVEKALKSLSPEQSIKIEKLISEEENWFKLIMEAQYVGKTGEEYSNLEDNLLKMKCEVIDLKDKVAWLEDMVLKLEDTVLKLKNHIINSDKHNIYLENNIKELEDTVVKLETKLRKLNKRLI
jgi:hypothetical protein